MSLREAGVLLFDCDHRTPLAALAGYPYVAIPQLKGGRIDFDGARLISEADYRAWTRRALPQDGDVVLSRRTNPGETASVPKGAQFALGQNLVILRSVGDVVYPPFLRWLARSPQWWEQTRKFLNVGALFDSLRCADIPKFELPIPPYNVQRGIAGVLGALDDKIELNRRMSATNRNLRYAVLDLAMRDLKPEVPLTQLASFANGGAFTAHANGQGRPIIRIRELTSGIDAQTPRTSLEVSRQNLAEPDTLLLAWSGSIGAHRWHGDEAVINQHIFKVIPTRPAWLVQYWLDRHVASFRGIAADKATTMGHIQRHHLDEALCAVPAESKLMELDQMLAPLYQLEHTQATETVGLSQLRDALLPELISGRMTVN